MVSVALARSDARVCVGRLLQVERLQNELAASVENKYESLWKSVEKSLENISTTELQKYHSEIRALSGKIENRMNLRISYCLDILAKAAETSRQKDLKRSVLLRLGFYKSSCKISSCGETRSCFGPLEHAAHIVD